MLAPIALLLLFILEENQVNAECCPNLDPTSTCADGVQVLTFQCCAYGACNFFCCNCDGGCRRADGQTKSFESTLLKEYDVDGNEHFDLHELRRYVLSGACGHKSKVVDIEAQFAAFDKNTDGRLSFDEINEVEYED